MKHFTLRSTIVTALVGVALLFASPDAAARKSLKVEKPNLEDIKTKTLDPTSDFYFPKLFKLYQKPDTVMTPEQYRYLYLGYMFQEDYDPYRESRYEKKIAELRQELVPGDRKGLDSLIYYYKKGLDDNPFDLRQMSSLIHAYKERGKDHSAKIWEYRLENLLGAIKSTGTGEDVEHAWYVVYPMHEYDLINLLGYEAVNAEYPADGIDQLIVEATPETAKRLRNKVAGSFYFNVAIPQEQYELKHPGDEEVTDDSPATAQR